MTSPPESSRPPDTPGLGASEPTSGPQAPAPQRPDALSLRRWFLVYAAWLAVLAVPIALLLPDLGAPWQDLFRKPGGFTGPEHTALKLLILALYFSVCTTFLPLPTTWLVAGLATRHVALTGQLWSTTLLVGAVGAVASALANMTDYHLMTWLLRSRRVARVRHTRLYRRLAPWFSRRPFWLLTVFNLVPIPVDVIRMLAATGQYPLRPFFLANLLGRFLRYALVAAATFLLGPSGWVAPVALLVLAVVLGVGRTVAALPSRRGGPRRG